MCYCYIYVCIGKPAYHMFKNDPDWAPSLHLGNDKLGPGRNESHQERDGRAEARKRKREEMEQEERDALLADEMDVQELDDNYNINITSLNLYRCQHRNLADLVGFCLKLLALV